MDAAVAAAVSQLDDSAGVDQRESCSWRCDSLVRSSLIAEIGTFGKFVKWFLIEIQKRPSMAALFNESSFL